MGVRNRNPKQHIISYSAFVHPSNDQDDALILVVTPRQLWYIRSLVAFYSSWRTQFAATLLDGDKYEEVTDEQYNAIQHTIASFPVEEEKMSLLMEKLDDMHLSIAQLCECITSSINNKLEQLHLESLLPGLLPPDYDWNPVVPDLAEKPALDGEKCQIAQAVHEMMVDLCQIVSDKLLLGYTASAVYTAVCAFLLAAGWFPPAWVLTGISAALVVAYGFTAEMLEDDTEAVFNDKRDIVCAAYSADSYQDMSAAIGFRLDELGLNAFHLALCKLVSTASNIALIHNGTYDIDLDQFDPYFCTACSLPIRAFFWQAELGTQPIQPGTYQEILGLANCFTPNADFTSFAVVSVPGGRRVRLDVVVGMGNSTSLSFHLGDADVPGRVALLSASGPKSYWTSLSATVDVPADCTRLYIDRGTFSAAVIRYISLEVVP